MARPRPQTRTPVAFGSIGIPIVTLQKVTGLSLARLSAGVGRICAPVSLIVPAYLILVMGGWKGLMGVFPAAAVCGVMFAGTQFLVSNFMGPDLTDIDIPVQVIVNGDDSDCDTTVVSDDVASAAAPGGWASGGWASGGWGGHRARLRRGR